MATVVSNIMKFQHQMTVVFLVCLVLGSIVTFLRPWIPVLFVFIYFAVGMFAVKIQRNSERFADSLYYLGFLLTLVALVNATLGDKVTEDIVRNLGSGLSTTLAGLALRVIVLQFRETITDQEEEAQLALEDEINKMVKTFSSLTKGIADFHREFSEEANHLTQGIRNAGDSVEKGGQQIADLPQVLERAIYPAAEAMAERLRQINISPDLVVTKLDAALAPVVGVLTRSANELNTAISKVRSDLTGAGEGLAKESLQIAESLQSVRGHVEEGFTQMSQLPAQVKATVGESLNELRSKLRLINFDTTVAKQQAVVVSLEAVSRALQVVAGRANELDRVLVTMRSAAEVMEATVTSSAKSSESMSRACAQIATLAPVSSHLSTEFEALHRVTNDLQGNARQAGQELTKVGVEIISLREDLSGVRKATADLLEFATKELKR